MHLTVARAATAASLALAITLSGCSANDAPPVDAPGAGTITAPVAPVAPADGAAQDSTLEPAASPSTGHAPSALSGDSYRVSSPGQTMPDAPYSAEGHELYGQDEWPPAGVGDEAWHATTEAFITAVTSPDGDQQAWLAGVRPHVTDRLLDRLARDGAREEVASWGAADITALEWVDGDHGVSIVVSTAGNPAWSQPFSLWMFGDLTWRVDTFGLPWR